MRYKNSLGFSLLEVLIGFVIIFSLILGTAQLLSESLLSKKNSELRFVLSEMASSKLEFLKACGFSDPELQDGHYNEQIENEHSGEFFFCFWKIVTLSSNLKSVEVECFSENRPEKKIRMMLYISKNLDF